MKIKSMVFAAILTGCIMFVGCEGNSFRSDSQNNLLNELKNPVNNDSNTVRTVNGDGDGFVLISAKLHRGKKWTKKKNEERKRLGLDPIAPCSTSFGICDVKFGKQKNVAMKTTSNSSIKLIFLKDVGAYEGKIFFSKDDGPFTFPEKIANDLGHENITIIPDDYITHISKEHPNGYVIVRCDIK